MDKYFPIIFNEPKPALSPEQKRFVKDCIKEWLNIKAHFEKGLIAIGDGGVWIKTLPTIADVDHSDLLERLLNGEKPKDA